MAGNKEASQPKAVGMIYKKMSDVMRGVEPIAKTRQNDMQNYKFRGIDDIYNMVQSILAKNGVISIPTVLDVQTEERKSKSGGALITRIITVEYTFYAEDGSCVKATVMGEGMDSGDKALNKAMTASDKYCLLLVFKIPTNDEKDSEYESPSPAPSKVKATKSVPSSGNGLATDKQKSYIKRLLKDTDTQMSDDELNKLTKEQASAHIEKLS